MREIKFRAWDKELSKMWFNVRAGGFEVTVPTVYAHGRWVHLPDNETVMQYTGLKDKNGVEIYEGDIVKCCHVTSIHVMSGMDTMTDQDFSCEWEGYIKWQANSCSYTIKHLTRIVEDTMLNSHEYEIIGNIHQNPELLTTK